MNITSSITVRDLNSLRIDRPLSVGSYPAQNLLALLHRQFDSRVDRANSAATMPENGTAKQASAVNRWPEMQEQETDFLTSILSGIEEVVDADTFALQIAQTPVADVLCDSRGDATDGLRLSPAGEEAYRPSITIGANTELHGTVNIRVDFEAAAETALRHLKVLGHSRIAFLEQSSATDARSESARFVARRLGIAFDPTRAVQLAEGSILAGEQATRRLLSQTRDFSALFCPNDFAALGAISALRQAGLECPRDVSVIGCDQLDATGDASSILTTVCGPLRRMGSLAAQTLLMQIGYPQTKQPAAIVLPPHLVLRSSTGPAASSSRHWISDRSARYRSTTAGVANH